MALRDEGPRGAWLDAVASEVDGIQWYFGMKAHAGVDAETGLAHSIAVTGACVRDPD